MGGCVLHWLSMARTCTVCTHPERATVNAALVAGEPMRAIAGRFTLSRAALQRHGTRHLPVAVLRAADAAAQTEADALLAQARGMMQRARAYEAQAVANGDLRVALGALREQRGIAELLAKIVEDGGSTEAGEPRQVIHKVVWEGPDGNRIGEDTLPLVANGSTVEYIATCQKMRALEKAGVVAEAVVVGTGATADYLAARETLRAVGRR